MHAELQLVKAQLYGEQQHRQLLEQQYQQKQAMAHQISTYGLFSGLYLTYVDVC